MADNIKLDKAGMADAIKRTNTAKECYDAAIKDLENIIYSLQDVLVGEAQVAMYNRYEANKRTFQEFSVEIGEYISGMKKVLEDLPEEDRDIATQIANLQ